MSATQFLPFDPRTSTVKSITRRATIGGFIILIVALWLTLSAAPRPTETLGSVDVDEALDDTPAFHPATQAPAATASTSPEGVVPPPSSPRFERWLADVDADLPRAN